MYYESIKLNTNDLENRKYLQYSKSYRSYACNSHVYFINVLQYYDENIQ